MTVKQVPWSTELPRAEQELVNHLQARDFQVAFQPIVCLGTGATLGQEVLARCKRDSFRNPMILFAVAAQQQACGRLGRVVREVAMKESTGPGLFLNIHPQELSQRWLVRPDDPMCLYEGPLFLEITESAAFRHFELSMQVLSEVRERTNARIVVDDFGVEFSTFERVLALRPEIVKLDKSLVRGLHKSKVMQRKLEGIILMCQQTGAKIVAEGLEEVDELSAVISCGADLGQGYLLGRPSFAPAKGKLPPAWDLSLSQETTGVRLKDSPQQGEPNDLCAEALRRQRRRALLG